jgi:hypothetical protein
MTPLQVPLWTELPTYRAFLHISQITHKNISKYRNFSLLSKALGKEHPSMFPKRRAQWKQMPISRALLSIYGGMQWRSWLRHCATNQKVTGLIPDEVIGIFHLHNPSGHILALGLTQPLKEMSTRNISGG